MLISLIVSVITSLILSLSYLIVLRLIKIIKNKNKHKKFLKLIHDFELNYKNYILENESQILCDKLCNKSTFYLLQISLTNFKMQQNIFIEERDLLSSILRELHNKGYKTNNNWKMEFNSDLTEHLFTIDVII